MTTNYHSNFKNIMGKNKNWRSKIIIFIKKIIVKKYRTRGDKLIVFQEYNKINIRIGEVKYLF